MLLAFLYMISELYQIIALCEMNLLDNITAGPKCFSLAFLKAK